MRCQMCRQASGDMYDDYEEPSWTSTCRRKSCSDPCQCRNHAAMAAALQARLELPDRVILVRHGESMANVDKNVWRETPDNMIELSDRGSAQALRCGKRIREIVGDESVDFFVSPFERTLQTARKIRKAFADGQIGGCRIEPRIREQEFGNIQGDDHAKHREDQQRVGRFWYRFPSGESGADVHSRVCAFWKTDLLSHNLRVHCPRASNVVVVTHGLTMRLILMQLFNWSPNTFHTVWNADNCDIYVLKKDLDLPGPSPYMLDREEGDFPKSSIELIVTLKGEADRRVTLKDYLNIPAPRTTNHEIVKEMLLEQHGIDPGKVEALDFFGGKFKKFC